MTRIRSILIALGATLLIMSPTILMDRYNVSRGLNTALFTYHYRMAAAGMTVPVNYKYKMVFTEFENPNQIAIARGMFKDKEVEIYISKSWWMKLDANERKILLYHELSHDLLEIHHQWCDNTSLMYPNKTGMIKKDADEMLKDLLRKYKEDSLGCKFPAIFFKTRSRDSDHTDDLRVGRTIFLDEIIVTN